MIIDDGSPSSRVLEMAQRLARMHRDSIVALVAGENSDVADAPNAASLVSYVQRCSRNVEALIQAVRQWQPQLLLINRSSELVSKSTINELVTQLPCPLVLVQ